MANDWDDIQQAELEREDFDRGYPRDDDRNLPGSRGMRLSPCQYLVRADTMETGLCLDTPLSGSAFCQRHFNTYWQMRAAAVMQAEAAMPMRSYGQLVLL